MRCAMYIGIDLGTTNIKVALYDGDMHLLGRASAAAGYMRTGDLVEFGADEYFDALIRLLRDLTGGRTVRQLAFTGQAETLACLDADGRSAERLSPGSTTISRRAQRRCWRCSSDACRGMCPYKTLSCPISGKRCVRQSRSGEMRHSGLAKQTEKISFPAG